MYTYYYLVAHIVIWSILYPYMSRDGDYLLFSDITEDIYITIFGGKHYTGWDGMGWDGCVPHLYKFEV